MSEGNVASTSSGTLPEQKDAAVELTDDHFTVGGTHVTNFDEKQRAIYVEAVRLHGDPRLIVSEKPSHHFGHRPGGALHFVAPGEPFDLSDFWRVFDSVRASSASVETPQENVEAK